MHRIVVAMLLSGILAMPAVAQTVAQKDRIAKEELTTLNDAQAALKVAEQNGAPQFATSLYNEALARLQFAQQNWSAAKSSTRDQSRLWALEALWASRAALAKARWIGTNSAIASLQADIRRRGGTANVNLADEPADLALNRGGTSKERVDFAQSVVDAAKAAGGDQVAADDLKTAQQDLGTARKILTGNRNSESADYLAYISEMMGRRALYTARGNSATTQLPSLQLQRTQLAQADSERQAASERAQRAQAEAQAAALQQQLAQEQANRKAQQAQIDQLRGQVEANRLAIQQRVEQDRAARTQEEQAVDQAYTRYQAALATGSATDIENARRQLEDAQIALRAVQSREQANVSSMAAEIDALRTQLQAAQDQKSMTTDLLAQRQAELIQRQQLLDALRQEREANLAARTQLEQQRNASITEAQHRRAETEAQAQAMQQQVQQAQAAAQKASDAAKAAQQQTAQAQAELEKTRQQLAQRDAEAHQLQVQQELARIAATRKSDRGLIVTLPGIFFDTGKSALKAGAKSTLDRIAKQLKGESAARIAVEGHTDNTGGTEKNLALSDKRAQAVRDYLVSAGIPADRITATGKGEGEPVATNKTVAGRQQNRRVELIITQ